MARPKLEIKPEQVEGLARLEASNVDIARFFGCSESTIGKRFEEEVARDTSREVVGRSATLGRLTFDVIKAALIIRLDSIRVHFPCRVRPRRDGRLLGRLARERLSLACDLEEELLRARVREGDAPGKNGSHADPGG